MNVLIMTFHYISLLCVFYKKRPDDGLVNRLTPNDPYMDRTAQITSKRCILYIHSTNIGT